MSEAEVVEQVSDLMRALDDVRKYRELAYAMLDFLAILVVTIIASILIVFFDGVYEVTSGFPVNGANFSFSGIPSSNFASLAVGIIVLGGFLGGILWVDRRVSRTKMGEWKKTMEEGVPGAVKLLSELDWESQLGMVSTSRIAYLFYSILKVAGYSLVTYFLLSVIAEFAGLMYWVPAVLEFLVPASIIIVLIFSKKSLETGFNRLRSLDFLVLGPEGILL